MVLQESIEQSRGSVKRMFFYRAGAAIMLGIGVLVVSLGFSVYVYLSIFLQAAQVRFEDIWVTVRTGLDHRQSFVDTRVNFLILGLDARADGLEKTFLTDAMVFASLHTRNGAVTMIPIPRDIWVDTLKTKINALYYYGTKGTVPAFDYMRTQMKEILGQSIDHVVVINYADLVPLVDTLGGVEVQVEHAFTDTEYPNPSYIDATTSAEPIYKTISFAAGKQVLTGARALEFVRSRHSADADEGSDIARSARQTELMRGLIAAFSNRKTLLSPQTMGALYAFWQTRMEHTIPDSDVVALGLALQKAGGVNLQYARLPIFPDEADGVITHPDVKKYGQWVWEPRGGDWTNIHTYITGVLSE